DAMVAVEPVADRIIAANPAACTLLGYDRDDLLAHSFTALHPGQLPALIVFTQAIMAKGRYWTHTLSPHHAGGRKLSLEYAGTLVPDHEPGPLILLTLGDLEQRR